MPDAFGKLSSDEIEKTLAYVRQMWGANPAICVVCRTAKWTLGDYVLVSPTWGSARSPVLNAPTAYPQIILTCNQCGHSMFINAVRAGIVPANG